MMNVEIKHGVECALIQFVVLINGVNNSNPTYTKNQLVSWLDNNEQIVKYYFIYDMIKKNDE